MLEGKERMRKYTIANITAFRGYVDKWKVVELLKTRVEEQWKWDARSLRDGRYLIECPSAAIARKMEKEGPMESPAFTLAFTPWTKDLYHPAKAEGALRWVKIKNLPMFCWDQDTVAKMLKPVGDLIQIGGSNGVDTEDLRVFIRMRKPWLLPCAFHCNIATLQHTYIAEMEPFQPPLSWDSCPRTEQQVATMPNNDKTEKPPTAAHGSPLEPPPNRADKGKAPISVLQDTPATVRSDG
ncbi:hypothetical protein J5N97_010075 [Dioscorea zingiberensis]|uniref:DUF4283 domain-containing protein n=1 Tax=Dioscorea zingiberensis TaxID=325984 RepID=A0A9D5D0P2_9LILI|nr:hypothetical protein J5N97_010075 [Dioscorea zingiberensis]